MLQEQNKGFCQFFLKYDLFSKICKKCLIKESFKCLFIYKTVNSEKSNKYGSSVSYQIHIFDKIKIYGQ